MAQNIQPGQWINIKVIKEPRRAASRKTMVRLFEKNPAAKKERQRLHRARPVRGHIRGGRVWNDRPPLIGVVKTCPGASYRILASLDVIKELESIAPYVEITPA